MVEGKKPNRGDQHAGCMIHDIICIDEQMKAGCLVEIFICYNCRWLMENGLYRVDPILEIMMTKWEPEIDD